MRTATREGAGPGKREGDRSRPVRVLFLAWGYSIHAQRRIRLFAEDPAFEVAVVSPHEYRIPGARTVVLSDDRTRREIAERLHRRQDYGSNRERYGIVGANLLRIYNKVRWSCCVARALSVIRAGDRNTMRTVLHSPELLVQVETGIEDLGILSAAAGRFRPDVIFLQTLMYPSYLAYYLPKTVPIIITFWNGDILWWAQWNGTERLLKKQLVEYGIRRAAAITVNSRSAFEKCLGHGASAEKVRLVRYPGVDRERFRPMARDEARRALGISAGKVILCPRGLGGYLNSDVIVEAAAGVAAEVPDVLFLFVSGVGGEPERENHRRMARGFGVGNHCRFDGQVPWEAMPTYYGASDAMVSISSNDSLPNCMMEAMACGVPVILGDIPQLRDWIDDGINGFLVPPRDPRALAERILRLVRDVDGSAAVFSSRNLDLVAREFDGARNALEVKDLVRRVAGRAP